MNKSPQWLYKLSLKTEGERLEILSSLISTQMSLIYCSCNSQALHRRNPVLRFRSVGSELHRPSLSNPISELSDRQLTNNGSTLKVQWSFIGGQRSVILQKDQRIIKHRKGTNLFASCSASSQIVTTAFTLGTIFVFPFYAMMVVAPKAQLTRSVMKSSIPYMMLGILYMYLIYVSWTPDSWGLLFGGNNRMPELPSIMKMFSNEMKMTTGWIHFIAIDLFAARQVFFDGLKKDIETRHSICLCLLCCPIGIASHVITKSLVEKAIS